MDLVTLTAVCAIHGATLTASLEQPCPQHPKNAITSPWAPIVAEAAQRFGIPASWIDKVMGVESGGHTMRNGLPIVSPAGAMGLMQLMPGTYADLHRRYGLGSDPFDPHDNIFAGAAYLREMFDRFGEAGFLAAYNAGPARYSAYLDRGIPLPDETISYLQKLTGSVPTPISSLLTSTKPGVPDRLFVPLSTSNPDTPKRVSRIENTSPSLSNARSVFVMNAVSQVTQSIAQPGNLFVSLSRAAP